MDKTETVNFEIKDSDTSDWKWQLKNSVNNLDDLRDYLELTEDEERGIKSIGEK